MSSRASYADEDRLRSEDPHERELAAFFIAREWPPERAATTLVAALERETMRGPHRRILHTLGGLTAASEQVVPALVAALTEGHAETLGSAARALVPHAATAAAAAAAVDPLTSAWRDLEGQLGSPERRAASSAARQLLEPFARALAAGVEGLEFDEPDDDADDDFAIGVDAELDVAEPLLDAAAAIGEPARSFWEVALGSEVRLLRELALEAAARLSPVIAVPLLTSCLESRRDREEAIDTLGQLGPAAAPAAPRLRALVADEDRDLAGQALQALHRVAPFTAADVVWLGKLVGDDAEEVAGSAAAALDSLGEAAAPVVVPIIAAMSRWASVDDQDGFVGIIIFNTLVSCVGKIGEPAIAPLVEQLGAANPKEQAVAAQALARIGPLAAVAIEPLRALLGAAEDYLRWHAADAIWKINGFEPSLLPIIEETLEPTWSESCSGALRMLAAAGEAARPLVSRIVPLLGDEHAPRAVKLWAMCVLDGLGVSAEKNPRLAELLPEALDDWALEPAAVRLLAEAAIGSPERVPTLSGEAAQAELAAIEEALGEPEADGEDRAVTALRLGRVADPGAIELLRELLWDGDSEVIASACSGLAELARSAERDDLVDQLRSALPNLVFLARDDVRRPGEVYQQASPSAINAIVAIEAEGQLPPGILREVVDDPGASSGARAVALVHLTRRGAADCEGTLALLREALAKSADEDEDRDALVEAAVGALLRIADGDEAAVASLRELDRPDPVPFGVGLDALIGAAVRFLELPER